MVRRHEEPKRPTRQAGHHYHAPGKRKHSILGEETHRFLLFLFLLPCGASQVYLRITIDRHLMKIGDHVKVSGYSEQFITIITIIIIIIISSSSSSSSSLIIIICTVANTTRCRGALWVVSQGSSGQLHCLPVS